MRLQPSVYWLDLAPGPVGFPALLVQVPASETFDVVVPEGRFDVVYDRATGIAFSVTDPDEELSPCTTAHETLEQYEEGEL